VTAAALSPHWRREESLRRLRAALEAVAGHAPLAEPLGTLRAMFSGQRPWEAGALRGLIGAVRAGPLAPAISVGDALGALDRLIGAPQPAWRFDSSVDEDAFETLGFAHVSDGIGRAARQNREGWWQHARANKAFIMRAVAAAPARDAVAVLGAGQAHGLPLPKLTEAFSRVILVDVDARALEKTVDERLRKAGQRARVELCPADVTGVGTQLARAIEAAVAEAAEAGEAEARLFSLCRSYGLPGPVRLLPPGERVDLLISDLLVTQLASPARLLARARFERRFGGAAIAQAGWVDSWGELALRLQQDHVDALADQAASAVITADVVQRPTGLDRAGRERPTGPAFSELGTDSLRSRCPRWLAVDDESAWSWPRYSATRCTPGALMDVHALRVHRVDP
jgi:hypothetical protein